MRPSSWPGQELRYESKENMHEVRVPNICIVSHIIYYIVPVTIVIVFGIKAVGFSRARQALGTKFTMNYSDIKDQI